MGHRGQVECSQVQGGAITDSCGMGAPVFGARQHTSGPENRPIQRLLPLQTRGAIRRRPRRHELASIRPALDGIVLMDALARSMQRQDSRHASMAFRRSQHRRLSRTPGERRRMRHEAAMLPIATTGPEAWKGMRNSWRRGRRRFGPRGYRGSNGGWVGISGLPWVGWPEIPGHPSRKRPMKRRPEYRGWPITVGQLPHPGTQRPATR